MKNNNTNTTELTCISLELISKAIKLICETIELIIKVIKLICKTLEPTDKAIGLICKSLERISKIIELIYKNISNKHIHYDDNNYKRERFIIPEINMKPILGIISVVFSSFEIFFVVQPLCLNAFIGVEIE